jgi:F-type H+-transporting ATPase subunit delta
MNRTERAKEYATALFMIAVEQNEAKKFAAALETVTNSLRDNPEYTEFLSTPSIPKSERIASLETVFGAIIPEDVLSFVKLLCEKDRMRITEACFREYMKLYDESKRVSWAYVKSAIPLTPEQKSALRLKLEKQSGRNVLLECAVDSSLLGGIVVEMDGKILDGSLRRRLQEVKEVMSQ